MNKTIKLLTFCSAIVLSFSILAFGQESECDTLYNTNFVPNYRSNDLNKLKLAIDSGKALIEKCASEEAYKDPIEFVKKQLPRMEKNYRFSMAINKFNNAVKDPKNLNVDEAFTSGKELLTLEPNFQRGIDVILTLASMGLDQALANNKKYNNETLNYAKQAIAKLEANTPSQEYGLWSYVYKTKEFPDGKTNALAWMNYTIGYIMYHHQGMEKEAVPYLYKSIQYNSNVRKRADVYQAIGDFYKKEYNRLDDERTEIAKKIQEETNEETKKQLIDKAKEILALQKGYAERMMDAYARARENAGSDQAYKNSLYETIKILYSVRFDGKTDGIDQYIASLVSKPMPDPTTPVTPIIDLKTPDSKTTDSKTTSTQKPVLEEMKSVNEKAASDDKQVNKNTSTQANKTVKKPPVKRKRS